MQRDLERSAAEKRQRLESAYYQATVHPLVILQWQFCRAFALESESVRARALASERASRVEGGRRGGREGGREGARDDTCILR